MSMSKEKNLTEKKENLKDGSLVRLFITFFLGFLACCLCFCSMSWAWFNDVSSTGASTITSGECSLSATIVKDDGTGNVTAIGTVSAQGTQSSVLDMETGTYIVTITLPANSASGYLVIHQDGGKTYYSEYLQRNSSEQSITFNLDLSTAHQSVTFTARWGIYSNVSSENIITRNTAKALG